MKTSDVHAMTEDQLKDELVKLKKEQFNLRFQEGDRPAGADGPHQAGPSRHRACEDNCKPEGFGLQGLNVRDR